MGAHDICLGEGGAEKEQPSVSEQVAAVDELTRKARAAAGGGHFNEVQSCLFPVRSYMQVW